jgi:predicted SPOUT superfamily RNA methylase MTH1
MAKVLMTPSPKIESLTILIPSSLTSESKDQKIRTYKVGQIARAASVFRVNRIIIYRVSEFDDSRFIDLLLRYAETPQYLRKHLFPIMEQLKYAGILPPLRTPHHPIESKKSNVSVGEFRVGVVVSGKKSEKKVGSDTSAWVDIGIDSPIHLDTSLQDVKIGERVNVRIYSRRPIQAELVKLDEIPLYWGYQTIVEDSLTSALNALYRQDALIMIATRHGRILDIQGLAQIIQRRAQQTAVIFGSPRQGVESILVNEGFSLSNIKCETLNFISGQGTATVRTEEAVWSVLSLLNLAR